MSKSKKRRSYGAAEKAAILRRHLADKVSVSDLCEEYGIQPSVFYGWQRQLFDRMEEAVEATSGRRRAGPEKALKAKVEVLEAKRLPSRRRSPRTLQIGQRSAARCAWVRRLGRRPRGRRRDGLTNDDHCDCRRAWLDIECLNPFEHLVHGLSS